MAQRGSMLLAQIDVMIERARLWVVQGNREQCCESLAEARKLIRRTNKSYQPERRVWDEWIPPSYLQSLKPGDVLGYHRRDWELQRMEEALRNTWEPVL